MSRRCGIMRGPLASHAAGFGDELQHLGYSGAGARSHLVLLGDLSGWLEDEGLAPAELTAGQMARFLHARRECGARELFTVAGAAPLLEYLAGREVVPVQSRPVPAGPGGLLLERYREYLSSERGLTGPEVARHVSVAGLFARSAAGSGDAGWTAADVTRFAVAQCQGRSRPSACKLLSCLRSFLRFAYLDGHTAVALWRAVPPAATWSASSLPRWVPAEQVGAMLAACDRRSAAGRRDFAILVLLSRLGLRAGEVAAMRLSDIDWRAGEMVVHGKGRRDERLPLPHDAGEAVADYLQHGRPRTADRSVFVRLRAPLRGLTPQGVSSVAYLASERAGLGLVGAHRLRHTAATGMLRAGASLAEVGQVLRQRSPGVTAIYAKVDHRSLRALARPWPGGAA